MVRTRIAPSPTGFPHIGTLYQALFNYAFAKKHSGQFIVRIEDTDQARVVPGAEKGIFDALDWIGLPEDESVRKKGAFGPYRQSERKDIYHKYALELVERGHAYYCFCSPERLDSVRKERQAQKLPPMYDRYCRSLLKDEAEKQLKSGWSWVIRLKVPDDTRIILPDVIRGDIVFDSSMIDDQILLKSDGFPTYHLAVVVDDHLMQITHVIRGEEWIPSGPKHILLYDFFGWEKPIFFHTPILRNPDKSKFSKRHGHTGVSWYRQQGFLPEAVRNYLALMGWSHPEEKDIFALDEFIDLFDLTDVKAVGPVFDQRKLEWMNGQYIMQLTPTHLEKALSAFYKDMFPRSLIRKTVPLVQERIRILSDYESLCSFFLKKPATYELDIAKEQSIVAELRKTAVAIPDKSWKSDEIGSQMLALAQMRGIKNKRLFQVLRIAITGKKISPPLNESMEILGKEECISRLTAALKVG